MPQIAAFKGLRFDPGRVSSISRVIAPPYDVVGPEMEKELLAGDPHNIIRLTLAKTPPQGRRPEDYAAAAERLRRWREEGTLVQDEAPCIYIVEQGFRWRGQAFCRVGFVGAVLLEEFDKGSIRPHERTMSAPRSDRLLLSEACKATLSQVLGVYSDPQGQADGLVGGMREGPPLYEFDAAGVHYRMWKVSEPGSIHRLAGLLRERLLFIADGHHRYESALEYRRRHRGSAPEGQAPEDYISVLCVSIANSGLKMFPTHRGVKLTQGLSEKALKDRLAPQLSLVKLSPPAPANAEGAFEAACRSSSSVGCYLPGEGLYLVEPRDAASLDALRGRFPQAARAWCSSAVGILHYVLLPDLCAIAPGSPEETDRLEFSRDVEALCRRIDEDRAAVAFLLPTMDPKVVEEAASRGERMPMKSTYFYPKVPAGLVIYAHDGGTGCQRVS